MVPLETSPFLEESSEGLFFRIYNIADAAEALTVKNGGGDTIETFSQNERPAGCDGTAWKFPFPAILRGTMPVSGETNYSVRVTVPDVLRTADNVVALEVQHEGVIHPSSGTFTLSPGSTAGWTRKPHFTGVNTFTIPRLWIPPGRVEYEMDDEWA